MKSVIRPRRPTLRHRRVSRRHQHQTGEQDIPPLHVLPFAFTTYPRSIATFKRERGVERSEAAYRPSCPGGREDQPEHWTFLVGAVTVIRSVAVLDAPGSSLASVGERIRRRKISSSARARWRAHEETDASTLKSRHTCAGGGMLGTVEVPLALSGQQGAISDIDDGSPRLGRLRIGVPAPGSAGWRAATGSARCHVRRGMKPSSTLHRCI
jgi:hypothetical protein